MPLNEDEELELLRLQKAKFLASQPTQIPQTSGITDAAMSAASGLARGIPTAIDMPAAALATGVEKLAFGEKQPWGSLFQENLSHGLNSGVDRILGPEYQPKTEVGKLAKGAGMAVGTLPLGGSGALSAGIVPTVGRLAAAGAGATLGSQVGGGLGNAVGGSTGEAIGSTLGGIGGGLAGYKTPEILRKSPLPAPNPVQIAKDFKQGYSQGVEPLKTSADYRAAASESFKKADALGGMLSQNVTNSFVDDAAKTLVPQTVEGKMISGNSEATQLAKRIAQLKDRPMSLQAAQEIDEHLGDVMESLVDPKTGHLTKQGYKISQLQSSLRRTIENAPDTEIIGGKEGFDAIKEGRKNWAIQARLGDIERIVARAEMMDNPATGIKTGFRTLASNPAKMRGYPDEVQKMIKKAAETGVLEDILKVGGSRLWTMVGSHFGAPGVAGGFFGSALSRSGAERLKMGQAEEIAAKISGQTRPTLSMKAGASARKLITSNPRGKIKP